MLNKLVIVIFVFAAVVYFVSSYEVTVEKTPKGFMIHTNDTKNTNIPSSRIIGGVEVAPHEFPFQAGLFIYKGKGVSLCGGTLIAKQWVLTAASCLQMEPDSIQLILGYHHSITNEDQVFRTTEYEYHSEWDAKTYQNDIGLVKLPEEAIINQNVQIAKLATGTDKYVGKEAIALGWGETGSGILSSVIRKVTTTVISNEDCAKASEDYKDVIQPVHICTSGEGPKGICDGDTGGPLLVDGVQVGIVSFHATKCSAGLPSVFTRVADFSNWIKKHLTDDGDDDGGDDDGGDDNGGDDDGGDDDGGDDDNGGDDDDNDDGGASTHSLLFVAVASTVMCLVRFFGLM